MTVIESSAFRAAPDRGENGVEQYLSIGEVAKARGVNVQSLRYYEKLGILVPAYINPDTGYRYYALEQIMILDTILLCVELGIPLKELRRYVDRDGRLEFERLLNAGRQRARERLCHLEETLRSIDHTLRHVHAQKAFLGRRGYYTRSIFPRRVITAPCPQVPDARAYETCLRGLFDRARERGLHATFPHGIISRYRRGQYAGSRMFLEVLSPPPGEAELLPAGEYRCFQEKREVHSDPAAVFARELAGAWEAEVIVSSMSPSSYQYDEVILEFQLSVSRGASPGEADGETAARPAGEKEGEPPCPPI